jgi:hypothetical protein
MLRRLFIDAREFWVLLVLIGLALLVAGWLLGPSERAIRIVGMFLQLGGLCTILLELSSKQVAHNVGGPMGRAMATIKWIFRARGGDVVINPPSGMVRTRALGTPTVVITQSIEEEMASLRDRVHKAEDYAAAVRRDLDNEVSERKRELGEAIGAINESIVRNETGGLHLSLIGIIAFFWGIVLTSVPVELADLFS